MFWFWKMPYWAWIIIIPVGCFILTILWVRLLFWSDERTNQSMGSEDFWKNKESYMDVVNCLQKKTNHDSCTKEMVKIDSSLTAHFSHLDATDYHGIFTWKIIEMQKWISSKSNKIYCYFVDNQEQNNQAIEVHYNELSKLWITVLDHNWIMYTGAWNPRIP